LRNEDILEEIIRTLSPYEKRPSLTDRLDYRELWLTGIIDDVLFEEQVTSLLQLVDVTNKEPIKLFINSPGGEVDQALALNSVIETCGCPVITIGVGMVHSAALLIYIAGTKRFVYPDCYFLIHPMTYATYGNVQENRAVQDHADRMIIKQAEKLASRTKWSTETWRDAFVGEQTGKFFSVEEMISAGVIHKVVTYKDLDKALE